jgi:DNA modification methylase
MPDWSVYELDYATRRAGEALVVHADCLEWLGRIPPSFDGNERTPLPRFTDLSDKERQRLRRFFAEWATLTKQALKPGGHVFLACNTYLAPLVYGAVSEGGLEYRGQIIRDGVMTLRGGDRPKGAEQEFRDVCTMPRGCYEPWGLFRNPLPSDMRIQDCLREHGTSGLRRLPDGRPFMDVIESRKTPQAERDIADHSSLKPQALLRKLVYAALPLGEGVVCDPFMGSGSTLAAAEAVGVRAVGVERRLPDVVDGISFHLVAPRREDAGGDRPPALAASPREAPIVFFQFAEIDAFEAERKRVNVLFRVRRTAALVMENHEPAFFHVVPLPAGAVARRLHLDAVVAVLDGIALVASGGNQVGVAVVIRILHQRVTILRNARVHELTDEAGEIGRHGDAFEPLNVLLVKRRVDVAQELQKVFHRLPDMRDVEVVRQIRVGIEGVGVERGRVARLRFEVALHVLAFLLEGSGQR